MTTRQQRFDHVTDAVTRLAAVWPALAPAARDLTDTAPSFPAAVERILLGLRDGMGAQSFDGPGGGAGGGSPIELLLITPTGLTSDPAAKDLAELDTALRHLCDKIHRPSTCCTLMCQDARTVWRIVSAWTPRQASDKERREVAAANDGSWCEHHAQARIVEPAEHHGTVSGNLTVPMSLCGYCYWQVRRKGRLPTGEAMDRRNRTGKDDMERVR